MRHFFVAIFLISYLLLPAIPNAATISILPGVQEEADSIIINGEILPGDETKFINIADKTNDARVLIVSNGGDVIPALEIGRYIYTKKFMTFVKNGDCASACGLIWLAGSSRGIGENGRVGFHAVYTQESKRNLEIDSAGNALVGAYLNRIGMNSSTIAFVTAAPPSAMNWLDESGARKIGLSVVFTEKYLKRTSSHNRAIELQSAGKATDYQEIFRLYSSAADAEFAGSQNNLGDLYEEGKVVPKDDLMAVYWYTRSAERGEPTAYLSLASILGRENSQQSMKVEALKFALLAVDYLPEGFNKRSAINLANSLTDTLPPTARAKAKKLAIDWSPLFQERELMSDDPTPVDQNK